jgi:hypothetical protein
MLTIEALLGWHEPPWAISQRPHHEEVARPPVTVPDARPDPLICLSKCCLFCMTRKKNTWAEHTRQFKSTYSAHRHTYRIHLRDLNEDDPRRCPDEACHATFNDFMHFRRHAAEVHWCFLLWVIDRFVLGSVGLP